MSQPHPHDSDAVLGGQTPPPVNAAVLGGVAGIESQLINQWGLSKESISRFSFETVFVDDNAEIIDRQQKEAVCYTVDINSVPLDLIYISSGSFLMGSELEQPVHLVNLQSFFIGKYPVTQKQYFALMNMNPSHFKGEGRYPVDSVSWEDAMSFCRRLSKLTNKKFTLPSESQWEYACRAGTDTHFHFGQNVDSDLVNCDYFNHDRSTTSHFRGRTTPVGIYPSNSWGLSDMHGNIREWCLDTCHSNYIGAPSDGTAWLGFYDDLSHYRSFRGGSWNDIWDMCTSYRRGFVPSNDKTSQNGFRICMSKLGRSI
jgi:formylglycine-generating enzyme required for sulfatase activity